MDTKLPEKARLLKQLQQEKINIPDFIYVSASDFKNENFEALEAFLKRHRESFKVIARSVHPQEEFFKGGTFDSLETYADLGGIQYARKKIINLAKTAKQLTIKRQQKFNNAPEINPADMGVIVMPFINGTSVMTKMIGDHWEFGYCRDRSHKVLREPYMKRYRNTWAIGVKSNMWFLKKVKFMSFRPKTFPTSKPSKRMKAIDRSSWMGLTGSEPEGVTASDLFMSWIIRPST